MPGESLAQDRPAQALALVAVVTSPQNCWKTGWRQMPFPLSVLVSACLYNKQAHVPVIPFRLCKVAGRGSELTLQAEKDRVAGMKQG